jgi:hypothetical protein
LIEAVEKVGAYGGDQEKWALRVLQRVGQQGLEGVAPGLVGKGEQLFKLVDDQQEGTPLLRPVGAQGIGQLALAPFQLRPALPMSRCSGASIRPRSSTSASISTGSWPGTMGPRSVHRSSRCGPTGAAADHGQEAGLHQGRLACAAVARHLQPAGVLGSAIAGELGGVGLGGVAQQGQGGQGLCGGRRTAACVPE